MFWRRRSLADGEKKETVWGECEKSAKKEKGGGAGNFGNQRVTETKREQRSNCPLKGKKLQVKDD